MKKIIDGKVYDTDKATKVAEWSNCYARNDFHYCEETLYRKRTGEYFIHGKGGAASRYASRDYDGWTDGEKIKPLIYKEAKQWAEEKLDVEDYEKEFGEIPEDESSETMTITIPASTAAKIRRAAQEQGLPIGTYITNMVEA